MPKCKELSGAAESAAFRDQLRAARELCARDAEAFDEVLFVLERLGSRLFGSTKDLGSYGPCLSQVAQKSVLVADSAETGSEARPYFPSLFEAIRLARNDALHQGAVARHLTTRVIEVAIILEDALATQLSQVQYLMVKNPIAAERWWTLSAVRQVMLTNAFSHLPLWWMGRWHFVSDHALACHLLTVTDRKAESAKLLEEVLAPASSVRLRLTEAPTCVSETTAHEVVGIMTGGVPVLVLSPCRTRLLGLVAPSDVL